MPYYTTKILAVLFLLIGLAVIGYDHVAGATFIIGGCLLMSLGDINYELERITRLLDERRGDREGVAGRESAPDPPQGP
ncbi:MAG TPA: hypothetical protein VMY35_07355 [Phycisphaerae bacterium]|nr:hypothetical protein [Phycisphaerae bacterium]